MVNNLLKDGANPNCIDEYGFSPLGLALDLNLNSIGR
jgi:hypothetical protein